MRKLFLLIALLAFPFQAKAEVNIFACEPEWAALAKEIGGDNVTVFSATRGTQDPHHISAKPSLLAGIRKADMVFCTGAGLEAGWLPVLMQSAGANLQPGQPGYMMASDSVGLMGKPKSVDRSMGDIHPEGNPHIQTDPRNMVSVARSFSDRLIQIDPANATSYKSRLLSFESMWGALIGNWTESARSLKGKAVITYHESWMYLLNWLGMKQVTTLEVKPGIPPTASHLETVLQSAKANNVNMILLSPFDNDQAAEWLSEKSGARIVRLPFTVGGSAKANDLKSLYDETINLLKATP